MFLGRYGSSLGRMLQYIVHQLYAGVTTEIFVLKELISQMAGIDPLPNLAEPQIPAMAGGHTLRVEILASAKRGMLQDFDLWSANSGGHLGNALIENKLALPLLVQLAQQRQSAVYQAPDTHLKSLASLCDAVCTLFVSYLL